MAEQQTKYGCPPEVRSERALGSPGTLEEKKKEEPPPPPPKKAKP